MTDDISEVVGHIHAVFREQQMTLAVAESCTGGLVSHYLTDRPGASRFFRGGIVAYAASVKQNILGVRYETIRDYGQVSEQTALEMAQKMRLLAATDYALSTTGNIGPDVLEGRERGRVYVAAAGEKSWLAKELLLRGDRASNKAEAALLALRLLRDLVQRR